MMSRFLMRSGLVLESPGAVRALLTWPCFSLTSYRMVSGLLRQGVQPNTVIDVGANIGQFAVAAARIMGAAVHSFEPLPDAVLRLRRNSRRLPSVRVYEMALGEGEGTVRLHVNRHRHSSSVLDLHEEHLRAFPHAEVVGTVEVQLRRLDAVLVGEFDGPTLLKIDVQGFEAAVLRGAAGLLSRVDYVVIETSFKPMYSGEPVFADLATLLHTFGFAFMRPVGWLEVPKTGEIVQMDALFARARPLGN